MSDASQHGLRQQRAREPCAAVESEQRRLSQALEHSIDLLGRQRGPGRSSGGGAPARRGEGRTRATTEASVRRAEEAANAGRPRQGGAGDHIVAAAGVLAAIAEEVASLNQDRAAMNSS